MKITVNLSPSDLKKDGSHFDLPIALGIALHDANLENSCFDDWVVMGELGLDGAIKPTQMIFPIALSLAKSLQTLKVLTSEESADHLSKIPGINVYAAKTLPEAIAILSSKQSIQPVQNQKFSCESLKIATREFFFQRSFALDFSDVKAQAVAKRAALIAAAGFHNILLEGSPGCGKSMILKRLRYILPPSTLEEILQSAMLDFLDAKEPDFSPVRKFRTPHHTATRASIFGGGSRESRIGEVALAHGGMLYFDELPHFEKSTLEALREPLEDNRLLVSRVNSKIEYATSFLFAASQNPCPCGNLLSRTKECRCTSGEVQKYKNRLSEPFLDRIDLFVQMEEPLHDAKNDVSSGELFEQVLKAFAFQKSRGQEIFNGKLSESEVEALEIQSDAASVLLTAVQRFGLSLRSVAKVKKVARTLADLDESTTIGKKHILESLSFRRR